MPITPQREARRSAAACRVSGQPSLTNIITHLSTRRYDLLAPNLQETPYTPFHNREDRNCIVSFSNMGMKRKHFDLDDASPTSISSSCAVSTPDAQSPIRLPRGTGGSMDMDMDAEPALKANGWDFASAHRVKPSDWGNRTRKRVRDNRPDERAIHGTLPFYMTS